MASTAAVAASYSPLSGLRSVIAPPNRDLPTGSEYLGTADFSHPAPAGSGGPPGATPPGQIGGVGAYTPDWAALINGDAGLKDAAAALAAGGAQNQAAFGSQIANAYESFGKNIDLAQLAQQLGMSEADLQAALGPDVQKLAQENTDAGLSTVSRLDKANQDAIRNITANLNKRGILHSGEAGYELDQQNLGYRQASSDAYQKFLGYLQQYQQGYLSAQQSNAQTLAGAYGSAADRVYNGNSGTAGVTATLDHVDSAGNAVYRGPDGQLYDASGNPYSAPAAATPSGGSLGALAPAGGFGGHGAVGNV